MRATRAFTLIELLIVVAIIAILAAIAVPNFLEAQMRAKVSRTQTDMRTVAVAIESYKVDQNKYPSIVGLPQYSLPAGFDNGKRAYGMTTPVAYLTSIPLDPFGPVFGNDHFIQQAGPIADNYYYSTKAYFDLRGFLWLVSRTDSVTNTDEWALQSKGPDKYYAPAELPLGLAVEHVDRPYRWAYDASNGTVSLGNIIRSGP